MRYSVFLTALMALAEPSAAQTETSLRPQPRGTAPAPVPAAPIQQDTRAAAFDDWTRDFRTRALAQGINGDVFDRAMAGVRFDPEIIRLDRNQSEFTKTIWDYLDTAVSDLRVTNGRAAFARHADLLARIEARYGVEAEIVTAIWGLESAYGTFRGTVGTIGALATLAYDTRRNAFFERELVAALSILQSGDVAPREMTGSWAGAMGHTQFIPTSYLTHAVDFDGDGRRDMWSDDPTDALASTAAYLAHFGWVKGQPWGVEVKLPDGFDYTQADRRILKRPSQWAAMGIEAADGRPVADSGAASILLPAGASGAAFMVFDNFEVIERYNTADAYVIAVGHLADRIAGGAPIQGGWPRGDRALTLDERLELQRLLTDQGFDPGGVDGKIGPLTIDAVRDFQGSEDRVQDGYVSLTELQRLRARDG